MGRFTQRQRGVLHRTARVFVLTLPLASCSTFDRLWLDAPNIGDTIEKDAAAAATGNVDALSDEMKSLRFPIKRYYDGTADDAEKKVTVSQVAYAFIGKVNHYYATKERDFANTSSLTSSALDILALAAGGAATAFTPVGTKTALAAVATAFTGTRVTLEKNVLGGQDRATIVNTFRDAVSNARKEAIRNLNSKENPPDLPAAIELVRHYLNQVSFTLFAPSKPEEEEKLEPKK